MAERRSAAAEGLGRLSEWADAHLSLVRVTGRRGWELGAVLALVRPGAAERRFLFHLLPAESQCRRGGGRAAGAGQERAPGFIEKNVKLRGKVHRVTEKGLEVEHIPISVPFITSIQRKWQPEGLLLVRLAGVELTPQGTVWLQRELKPPQVIWFQLLGREHLVLECLVLVNKGRFSSVCLNEEVLREGLGRAASIEGLQHDSHLFWKLHKRLLRAELRALRKSKGIWKEESFSERIRGNETPKRAVWPEKLRYLSPADWLLCHSSCADFRAEPWLLEAAFPRPGIHAVDVYSWLLPRFFFLSSTAQLCICVSTWGGSAASSSVSRNNTRSPRMGHRQPAAAGRCAQTQSIGHTDTALLLGAGGGWAFLSVLTYKEFFHTERSQCAYSLLLQ